MTNSGEQTVASEETGPARYRIEWEMVGPIGPGRIFYAGERERPNCRPEEVPDEYWTRIKRETPDPWDQFHQLSRWAESGEELIRNVTLWQTAPAHWTRVVEPIPQAPS